jgi:hypothetical protein
MVKTGFETRVKTGFETRVKPGFETLGSNFTITIFFNLSK